MNETPLYELRSRLVETTATHGRGSSHAQAAFELLVRTAAERGNPIDALRVDSTIESERFFARVFTGPDGHAYWEGTTKDFALNPGSTPRRVRPRRWWWAHVHGPIAQTQDVVPICGEPACIAPDHCVQDRAQVRIRYPLAQIIGTIKVAALRLGRAPRPSDWEEMNLHPTLTIVKQRFGSWPLALEAAGMERDPGAFRTYTDAECIAAVRLCKRELRHWPAYNEYVTWFKAESRPDCPSAGGLQHRYGGWRGVLDVAQRGKP